MEPLYQSLSLPSLALQYGTINKDQFTQINKFYALKQKEGVDYDQILLTQRFATRHQVGLLKLIQGYLILKEQGEEFGKIAISKGLATQKDIDKALAHQKKEFQRAKIRKLIGDILVEDHVITQKQKNIILKEQKFLDTQTKEILAADQKESIDNNQVQLSKYEQDFLKTKVLDKEFAAIVKEKGFASAKKIKTAQNAQEKAFEEENEIHILGDIMVELNFLTLEQNNLILKAQTREPDGKDQPPPIELEICNNNMEAFVIVPKKLNGTVEDIKKILSENDIKYGIYPDALLQCNLDQKIDRFIVAKQDISQELVKARQATFYFLTDENDSEVKKKGETLGEQRLSGGTCIKKDLYGNNIELSTDNNFAFRCAAGTRLSKDNKKALANRTGIPSLSIEKKMYVHPVVNILEDADLKYGKLEKFANLNIKGILTGAYKTTAGEINAQEIRGANIDAVGDIKSQVGISDSVISTQGDVHALYIHNSKIETFGNIYVKNEIIDSQLFSSGKIDSGSCKVIGSSIFGKKGIELYGVGSDKTKACTLRAGTEHHIIEKAKAINGRIKEVSRELDDLKEQKKEQDFYAEKTFQKMVEQKIFHDRAKIKNKKLKILFKEKKDSVKIEKLKNIIVLNKNFEKRMKSSLAMLKKLNSVKKKHDKKSNQINIKIKTVEPRIKKKVSDFQKDLFAFFEWTKKQESNSQIKINKKIIAGTIVGGVFSFFKILNDEKKIDVIEKKSTENIFHMKQKNIL